MKRADTSISERPTKRKTNSSSNVPADNPIANAEEGKTKDDKQIEKRPSGGASYGNYHSYYT